jgi:hypothetical protein
MAAEILAGRRVAIDLAGVWKDQRCGLLVVLHSIEVTINAYAESSSVPWTDELKTVKGVMRLTKGSAERVVYSDVRLEPVMPKRPGLKVQIVQAYPRMSEAQYKRGDSISAYNQPEMWNIEGVLMGATR